MKNPVMPPFQALFSLQGRMRRRDYWIYSIGVALAAFLINYIAFRLWGTGSSFVKGLKAAEVQPVGPFIMTVYAVNTLGEIPRFFIGAKRWRDRGKSAWISALVVFLSLVYYSLSTIFHLTDVRQGPSWMLVIYLPMLAMVVWTFVECGCLDSKHETNKYGAPPKNTNPASEVF